MAIKSFVCADTANIFNTGRSIKFNAIARQALKKLNWLNAATVLSDLKDPSGNRLDPLKDDRLGQHSISVNDQFRICFVWTPEGPSEVEIVDYH